jgi:hypothetical protein
MADAENFLISRFTASAGPLLIGPVLKWARNSSRQVVMVLGKPSGGGVSGREVCRAGYFMGSKRSGRTTAEKVEIQRDQSVTLTTGLSLC